MDRKPLALPPHNSHEVAAARRQGESGGCDQLHLDAATSANSLDSATSVPLRRWITHILARIGGSKIAALSSPAYLGAALKIALSLSQQIVEAERLADRGVRDQLDSLDPRQASDWADRVLVQLKSSSFDGGHVNNTNEQADDINEQIRALLHESTGSLDIEDDANDFSGADLPPLEVLPNGSGSESGDINARFEAFMESFQAVAEANKKKYMLPSKTKNDQEEAKLPQSALEEEADDLDEQLSTLFNQSFGSLEFEDDELFQTSNNQEEAKLPHSALMEHKSHRISLEMGSYTPIGTSADLTPVNLATDAKNSSCCEKQSASAKSPELDYFDVVSARIQNTSREGGIISRNNMNTAKEKAQRIYYLGLIFYELFSGGEAPPTTLLNLASVSNAFVSLSTMTLFDMTDDLQNAATDSSKRHQGSHRAIGLCQSSCEYLRLIGIPSPICQLIFNMLDCIYGDFGGKECYSTMSEVTFDLQLLIDKPCKFLRGLDMNAASLALRLNEMKIPRDRELDTILSCHRRCLEGSCEIAIIRGESGSGKSWMSQKVGKIVTSMGGIFVTGKFNNQLNQVRPFSALASAFDQYCDFIVQTGWVNMISVKLQTALGQDACHLINVIPKLGLVIKDDARHTAAVLDMNCRNYIQRLHHLFCRFLEVVTTNAQVSLTLCLDDIQWADEASIAVLTRLLMQRNGKFFFLGCCRDDEMESDHKVWKMLETVNTTSSPPSTTTVQLKGVGEEVLNEVVSELLSLSPRLVRPLSRIIHSKTRGNILFFSQLMLSLHRDSLLFLDFSKDRWVWNEEKILSMKLPENVAICFTNGIKKLPNDLQSALHTLSLFGASVKVEYFELLESQLGLKLIEPLARAAAEGLVINRAGGFHFCHDSIQEASYNLIEGDARQSKHLLYGRCLVEHAEEKMDDDMIFTAVNQINQANTSDILDKSEYYTIANYNLIVGKKAMAMSAFSSAYSFFKEGIAILLRVKNHWKQHYKFSIEIFELAIKSSLAAGNLHEVLVHSDELLKHAKCFADTLNTHFTVMLTLSYSNMSNAVQKGADVVSKLGEEITINPSEELLDYNIKHTQWLLRGASKEQLLNHRVMTNSNKLAIMKFLVKLQSFAYFTKPELHKLVIMKMVQLSMDHGLSSYSAFGFACFGSFLSKLGNLTAGHQFIVLSKSLSGKFDAKESSGELIAVVAEVQAYIEPLLAANELRVQGEAVAISEGDMAWACLLRLQYCADSLWAGTHLSTLQERVSNGLAFVQEKDHKTSWGFMLILERTVNILLGKETTKLSLAELSKSMKDNTNARLEMSPAFHNLYLSILLNDGSVQESCEKFLQKEIKFCILLSADAVQAFCVGLAAFQIYRQTRLGSWLEKGRQRIKDMELWVEQGSAWNFQQKAEEHYSNGNLQSAADSYKAAISFAKLHKFLNDESLAYELAARFYLDISDRASSFEHFRLAHETYIAWGAVGKASCLAEYIDSTFAGTQNKT